MSDTQATILTAFFFFLAFAFAFAMSLPMFRRRQHVKGGAFLSKSGRRYEYKQGENLYANKTFGQFNGLEVLLPVALPHIYLDSLKSGGQRVSAVLDQTQRLRLEGDFNKYFNVFVPRPYEAIALSILTPDVMHTLREHAADVDVELYGRYLRIITNRKVSGDVQVQEQLLAVALPLLDEIEHKQRSWLAHHSDATYDQDLWVARSGGLRVAGRYISWRMVLIGIFMFCCTVPFFLLGLLLLRQGRLSAAIVLVATYIISAVGLHFWSKSLERGTDFKSRSGRNRQP